jgi:hypothetical protein
MRTTHYILFGVENVTDKNCTKNEIHVLCPTHVSVSVTVFEIIKRNGSYV